jgi:hypothetical protein
MTWLDAYEEYLLQREIELDGECRLVAVSVTSTLDGG